MRIGIDLGGTKIECVALDAGGRELFRRRIPTPRNDYEGTLRAIVGLIEACETEIAPSGSAAREHQSRAAVGLGTPGAVSPATGLMKNANSVWLNGRPLPQDLERILGRPVRLANDANCFALSEAVDGAGAGCRTVFGVILGTGTGGGIVVERRALTGPNAVSGEWGHNPLPWPRLDELPGPPCYCGRQGCIETYLSGPGLVRDYLAGRARGSFSAATASEIEGAASPTGSPGHPMPISAEAIVSRAEGGEAEAVAAMDRYVDRAARAFASVINLLDPDVIVLGGGMSNAEILYREVPRIWGRWVFSDRVSTPLRRAVHGDSSGVRGAAWLWPA